MVFWKKDEGLITFLIRNSKCFSCGKKPGILCQKRAWTLLLTETTCSGNYKGQGENHFGASYHLRQCHFHHYQRVLEDCGEGEQDKGSGNSEAWIITPVYLTYDRPGCTSICLIKDVLSI